MTHRLKFSCIASCLALTSVITLAETAIFYTPMLDAYRSGRTDDARRLAAQYIARVSSRFDSSQMDIDRDSAVVEASSLVAAILREESAMAAPVQFGGNAILLNQAGDLLGRANDVEAVIAQMPAASVTFRRNSLADTSAAWIQSAAPWVPAVRLQLFYDKAAPLLRLRGIAGYQDAVQSPNRLLPLARTAAQPPASFAAESAAVRAAVAAYMDALISGNSAGLAKATGVSADVARNTIQESAVEFQRAKVRRIVSYQLPQLANWGDAVKGAGPRYSLSLQNITLRLIDADGNQADRIIDKQFNLRRKAPGSWLVVLARKGGNQ